MAEVVLVGLGEVGRVFAEEMMSRGYTVRACDPACADPGSRASSHAAELGIQASVVPGPELAEAALVISAVTPGSCVDAAREVAALLVPGAWFFDLNSAAPDNKVRAAALVDAAGGRYVEAALMSAIRGRRLMSPFVLGGSHASAFAEVAGVYGLGNVTVDPGPLGHAAATKLARSIVIKGMEALFTESMLAARRHGVEEQVLASLSNLLPEADWEQVATYFLERTLRHGVRRSEEMAEAAAMVRDAGVEPVMSLATAERQALSGALRARLEDSPTLGSLIDLLDHTDAPHPPSQEETRA